MPVEGESEDVNREGKRPRYYNAQKMWGICYICHRISLLIIDPIHHILYQNTKSVNQSFKCHYNRIQIKEYYKECISKF